MLYDGYHLWGMHLIWWFVWFMFLIWIFAIPNNIPFQRMKKDSPLDILKQRFALGEITNDEYLEKKKILENILVK
jgi:putative membrane protein